MQADLEQQIKMLKAKSLDETRQIEDNTKNFQAEKEQLQTEAE